MAAAIQAQIDVEVGKLEEFNAHFNIIIAIAEKVIYSDSETSERQELWLEIHAAYCNEWAERASKLTHLKHIRDLYY